MVKRFEDCGKVEFIQIQDDMVIIQLQYMFEMLIISCELKNGHMYICFTDNGGGIQKEILDKIFNPYFTTKGTKGTGLGLYMSKKIMNEKCDGDIKVKSKNGYTTFIISIGPKVLK